MQETRRRGLYLTLVAIIMALVTGFFFFVYLNSLERVIGDRINIVVAAVDIPARTLITPDMLTETELPRQFVHDSYYFNPQDLALGFVTITDIEEGQPVQRNMIDANAGLEPGFRAISLAVDQVGSVGGNVRPGNRVDIIVSYVDQGEQALTRILLEDVRVLAVNSLLPSGSDTPGGIGPSRFLPDGQLIKDAVITLALNPDDASRLAYMASFGSNVQLAIRRLDETDRSAVDPVGLDDFGP